MIADFSDKASLTAALRGVESVYLVCSPIPALVQLEGNAIESSQAAGVRRIVLNSALGAGDYDIVEKAEQSGWWQKINKPS